MEQQPKYNLSDCTADESTAFMKEFNELLNKHSLYFEPVPAYTRKALGSPWELNCQIFLQKKTPIEDNLPVADSIPSPFTDETNPTA